MLCYDLVSTLFGDFYQTGRPYSMHMVLILALLWNDEVRFTPSALDMDVIYHDT